MLNNFAIDYTLAGKDGQPLTHRTDDPVEAEEFLGRLLAQGAGVREIRHEGVSLTDHQFDRMLRIAAERAASGMLSRSLKIDSAEVKHRFGFAA